VSKLRSPDATIGPFREKNSVVLTAIVLDNSNPPVPIPGPSLSTATFTLYSEAEGFAIINSRDHVDIKSNIDANGVLTLPLHVNDLAIVDDHTDAEDDEVVTEYHRALFEWSWPTGRQGSYEIRIVVRDVNKVT